MSSIVRRAAAVPGVAVVALALCTLLWSRVAAASARPAAARGVRRASSCGRRAVPGAVSRDRRECRVDGEEVFVLRKDMAAWANATGTRAGDKPISARNARDSWRGTVSCAGQTHLSKFFAYHSAGGLVGPYRKALRARENRESSEPLGARAGRPAFSAHVGPRKNVSFVISLVVALMASNAPSKSLPATRTEPTPTS